MTLFEFEQDIFTAAMSSRICDIPAVRRLTPTSISLRIHVAGGGFIDAFYNEQTGTTAFALIQQDRRVFGADNTGGWHIHPFAEPDQHIPLPGPLTFADFVAEIEHR
jgi:hypothetical protein